MCGTTGINRIQSELTYNGSDIALKQLVQWDPTMYLNVWVVHSSDGGNGSAFAFYPADVERSASIYDGVVSSYWAVGRTETAVWTHYKILTHEVGHWANLKHTWGDQSGNQSTAGCGFDDAVEDTPNADLYKLLPPHGWRIKDPQMTFFDKIFLLDS